MLKSHISKSESDTIMIGKQFSSILKNGDVVAFYGDLGTGKTQLIKGICQGLGFYDIVTSPSFTIMNVYKGNKVIYHFDFYRIDDNREINDLGLDDFFFGEEICLIEWAERVKSYLPPVRYDINIDYGKDENFRLINILRITDENIRN